MRKSLGLCTVILILFCTCTNPNVPTETYQIIYKAGDSDSGSPPADDNRYAAGETVVLLGNPGNLAKSNYQFAGWCCVRGDEANAYAAGGTLSMPAEDIALSARWVHTAVADMEHREMVSLPGGSFVQREGNTVSFDHSISTYQIGKYEVSYELWWEVFYWATLNGYNFSAPQVGKTGDDGDIPAGSPYLTNTEYEPVTHVSWPDAILWCNAYSEMTGLMPVYYRQYDENGFSDPLKSISGNLLLNWWADGYRLPTEGEWQFAAAYQDGSSWTAYNYASGAWTYYNDNWSNVNGNDTLDGIEANSEVAVYYSDEETPYTTAVETGVSHTAELGTKAANQLGLYDMSGNVFEWCWDWYADYPDTPQVDYRGPSLSPYGGRSLRGGSWDKSSLWLQVGQRAFDLPETETAYVGFRVARTP